MRKTTFFTVLSLCTLLFAACQQAPEPKPAVQEAPKPDMAKVKAEIQAVNNAWAAASNARDAAAILAFYADDAISMNDDKPMMVGKAAITKDSETWFAKSKEGSTVSYETMDVFGDETRVTEIGKITTKDAAGKVTYTGKYMAVWEKRDGKWLTIRDISNDDEKEK
jgi:uncharacterized protein (TIGR02246 family)